MNIAIVGTSIDLTEVEKKNIKQRIEVILKKYDKIKTTIITGGAKGVDSLAMEVGLFLGFAVKPIFPMGIGWKYNKPRNLEIVNDCDELYCISIPNRTKESRCYHHEKLENHEKTAGCWTMRKALEKNKKCELLVVNH